jgi:hypothetical protein
MTLVRDQRCYLQEPRIETDESQHTIVANTSNIDQGPEIGHTGHYLGAVIGAPIGGAVGLALIVLVWLVLEKPRKRSGQKSTTLSQGSEDSMVEGSIDLSTDSAHKNKTRETNPYWGDF